MLAQTGFASAYTAAGWIFCASSIPHFMTQGSRASTKRQKEGPGQELLFTSAWHSCPQRNRLMGAFQGLLAYANYAKQSRPLRCNRTRACAESPATS